MGNMNRMGESMSKRPMIPLLIILLVTAASMGIIANEPPSFDMDEGSFAPDNDITKAASAVSAAFSSSASVMVTMDASAASGDVFKKDVFLDILAYEQSFYGTELAGKEGFGVASPISATAGLLVSYGYSLEKDVLTDTQIKVAAYNLLTSEEGAVMASLLTNDMNMTYIGTDTETGIKLGSVSAKGCIISVMVLNSALEGIEGGMIGFEKTIEDVAFTPAASGLTSNVVDLTTMMDEIGAMSQNDMSNLIPIALILIVIILLLMYRDIADTLIGLFGLVLAIIWTFGISILIGLEMTTIAIAVPILLMGLGIDYGLHLVFRYREERMNGNDSAKANGETVNSVGEALVLATVTTMIAFLSYLTSSMTALADFGTMCAIGIVCAFVAMLLLIPAMQSIRDSRAERKGKNTEEIKRFRKSDKKNGDIIGTVAGIGGRISAKNPWAVIGVTCIALAGFGYCATNLSYEFDMYSFIPDGTDAGDTLHYMNDNYSTTTDTASVLVYADGWQIETMKAIEESVNDLNTSHVSGLAYNSVSKRLEDPVYINLILTGAAMDAGSSITYKGAYNAVFDIGAGGTIRDGATQTGMDALKAAFYASGEVPAKYLQAMSSVSGTYNDNPVTQIVLNLTPDAAEGGDAAIAVRNGVDAALSPFGDNGMTALTTGSTVVMAVTLEEMNSSQMSSLIMTLILVLIILTIVMYITDRSWLLGTMATIPTLISVVLVWGSMALMGISLNVLTLTIASLTVGMGVTYGIHIAHRFVTDIRDNGHSARDAILTATRETGKGVFGAALTTAAGFGVIGFSAIVPMQQFGIITALAIAFGYIGATFILPALLVIWGEFVTKRPKSSEETEKA